LRFRLTIVATKTKKCFPFIQVDLYAAVNVLLTVHHAMILGNCPTWRTNSFQCIYLFI